MTKAESILNEFIKGDICRDYSAEDRDYYTISLSTALRAINKGISEGRKLKTKKQYKKK